MPSYFEIQGGKKLSGTIDVRGSKNAATPILAATLLTSDECILSNMPRIEDVLVMIRLLESMGVDIEWINNRKLRIRATNVDPTKIDFSLMKKLRSSILLLGPMAARFDAFEMYHPGGCVIGARPVGTHFDALEKMGVHIRAAKKRYVIDATGRSAQRVVLREFSVTATENAMMLAARLPQTTEIRIAAAEPHVEDLGKFLRKMGVKITGLGTHTLKITGLKNPHGTTHSIMPDANEAATFLLLGAATMSNISVRNARQEHLDIVLEKLRQFGVDFKIAKNNIQVIPSKTLTGVGKLDARIYPGIPTDVQAPFGVLATQAQGETLIHDTLYEGRFNYIGELQKMGADAQILNPHQAIINGPTVLRGTTIHSYDLRSGAALIIAALVAKDTTIIKDIHQVDRGYELIEQRLQKLGANIERKQVDDQ